MSRYIDADKLKEAIFAKWYTCEEIDETIDQQPTADVVEVVRCENCWFYESLNSACGHCHSERWGNGFGNYPPPVVGIDGFCKCGERKEK